jgi:hypothetical protein
VNALADILQKHRSHRRAMAQWESIQSRLRPPAADASGLTICSVAFRAKHCLEVGDRLMRDLNPTAAHPTWLLFDNNTDPGEALSPADPRFTVVKPSGREVDLGYEHALGISALLERVQTRFLLILDPDCFIVMPDWLRRVPAHMMEQGLGFFGTPINPQRHNSYRYFPYMVCMFVDLARVPLRDLCFVPDVWKLPTALTYRARRALAGIPKIGYLFRWLLTEQWLTNGWRIKQRFGAGDRVKFECVQPVWDPGEAIPPGSLKRMIHSLTPGSVSPVPKREGYCSPRGFREMGAPDIAGLGWEEFVWRDRPFAFHVGSVHGKPGQYERQLDAIVAQFSRQQQARPA